jgi:hypothetical protein
VVTTRLQGLFESLSDTYIVCRLPYIYTPLPEGGGGYTVVLNYFKRKLINKGQFTPVILHHDQK